MVPVIVPDQVYTLVVIQALGILCDKGVFTFFVPLEFRQLDLLCSCCNLSALCWLSTAMLSALLCILFDILGCRGDPGIFVRIP
jgi:hypothetical protein